MVDTKYLLIQFYFLSIISTFDKKYILFRFVFIIFLSSFFSFSQEKELIVYKTYDEFYKTEIIDKNKTYVINFWATWCAPCVKELPYFEEAYQKMKNENIQFILVSLDFKKNYKQKLIPFLKKKKPSSKVVLLTDSNYNNWLSKVDKSWSGSIPATWVIKGTNEIFAEQSFESSEDLEKFILKINK